MEDQFPWLEEPQVDRNLPDTATLDCTDNELTRLGDNLHLARGILLIHSLALIFVQDPAPYFSHIERYTAPFKHGQHRSQE
jgi:hypothetical protein